MRLLNISGNLNNENLYSGIFNWDGSNFRVDILEKKGKETGYAQKKMYRIQIEADTQLAGEVFIDAFFLDKGTELNLYVDERFQKAFTENSSLLYRRLRNDGFLIKAINIRNALSNENIIEKKIEIILPAEGRFSKLA